MEDVKTKGEIKKQIGHIQKNNLANMDSITSVELLLTSDNNGTVKDGEISRKFMELKKKMTEVAEMTNDFISILDK